MREGTDRRAERRAVDNESIPAHYYLRPRAEFCGKYSDADLAEHQHTVRAHEGRGIEKEREKNGPQARERFEIAMGK